MEKTATKSTNPNKTEFLRLLRDFSPGTVIDEAFEVKEFVELGGMGYLFRGFHRRLKRDIAIKVLKKQWVPGAGQRNYFLTEGHQMARIHHQYVARIYDVGVYKGHYYLIMDFIEGENLYKYIKENSTQGTDAILEMMAKLAEALSAVHKEGIIHRDIKPANIMITPAGDPVLLDFGIAKPENGNERDDHQHSPGRCVTGTPAFIAPECYKNGDSISPASDVYSLGKTFYYLLTGTLPQNGKNQHVLTTKAQCLPKSISAKIEKLINRMTHEDPRFRPSDGKRVVEELRKVRNVSRVLSRTITTMAILLGFVLAGLWSFRSPRPTDWVPRPRVIAVIPNTVKDEKFSYISYEFENAIRRSYPYYEIVDRNNIKGTIDELELIQEGWISKANSAAIGKMVGAHIFINFEKGSYNDQTLIYPKAYDVETTLLLGNTRIEPDVVQASRVNKRVLTQLVSELMEDIDRSLIYRSFVASADGDKVVLEHGQLYGAQVGMMVSVLNRNEDALGLLEITTADKHTATAKIVQGNDKIRKGLRVEELKEKVKEPGKGTNSQTKDKNI